jgi:hypothetical protein
VCAGVGNNESAMGTLATFIGHLSRFAFDETMAWG